MSEELKQNLSKIVSSRGTKQFFFAFGTGKRKDGKGDGALALGPQKPKKDALNADCECADFFEGRCWCSPDGATVFFKGKGKNLSQAVLAKMMLSTRKVTGRQYEFALPSEEEEARIAQVDGSESESTAETTPDLMGQFKGRLPAIKTGLEALKTGDSARYTELTRKLTAAVASAQARDLPAALAALDEIDAGMKAPVTSTPSDADLAASYKTKLTAAVKLFAGLLKTAPDKAQPLKAILTIAQKRGQEQNYKQGLSILTELSTRLQATLKTAARPPDNADVLRRLNTLKDGIKTALAGPNAARVQTLVAAVNGLLKNKDFVQAGKVLDELEPLVNKASPKSAPVTDDDRTALLKRLSDLRGAIKAALGGPNGSQVQTLVAAVGAAINKNDLTTAKKQLAELEALTAQPTSPSSSEPGAKRPSSETSEQETQETEAPEPSPKEAKIATKALNSLVGEELLKRLAEVQTENERIERRLQELAAVPVAERTDKHRKERQELLMRMDILYQDLRGRRVAFARSAKA